MAVTGKIDHRAPGRLFAEMSKPKMTARPFRPRCRATRWSGLAHIERGITENGNANDY
jgi:hypothetical protein